MLLSLMILILRIHVSAQTFPSQSPQATPPPIQYSPMQQGIVQQQPIQIQPIQAQPIKAPPFGTPGNPTPGNPSVYQQFTPMVQPTAQPNVGQPNVGQSNVGQPIRVATANPPHLATPIQAGQPGAVQGPPPGMAHVGRAAPVSKVTPFFLDPAEQQELDLFLARWERYSAGIKRYDVEFNMFDYDLTIPGAQPNVPNKVTYGYFKYIASPTRFVYVVDGEWQDNKKIKRNGDKNPHIFAEKIIIDEKTVYKYDYTAKTKIQINVPPEMIGKGIADSPLPLIFGAKADELKRRFSMKIVSDPSRDDIIWLHARPLLMEDQQEFKELEILINKRDLAARGLKQWDINDKAYKVYELHSLRINERLSDILKDIASELFLPISERGWKEEVVHWTPPPPVATPGMPQPPVGQPPQYRNEVPLYRAP